MQTRFAGADGDGQILGLKDAPPVSGLDSSWTSEQGREIRYDLNLARAAYQVIHDHSSDLATGHALVPLHRLYSDVLTQTVMADKLVARGLHHLADQMLSAVRKKVELLTGIGKGLIDSSIQMKDLVTGLYEHKGELWARLSNRYEKFLTDARYTGPDAAVASILSDAFSAMKETAAEISKTVATNRDTLLFGPPHERGRVLG